MIYDMVTGNIISGNECPGDSHAAEYIPAPDLALQTIENSTPIEEMTPVDAYMVMLQDLLKKL
jgi:hypothetical protein